MDYNDISALLERYFEGETTLEEERTLRRYFAEGPVAEEHLIFQDLFDFFSAGQEKSYQGTVASPIYRPMERRVIRIRPVFWRAAAVVAVAVSAWLLYPENEPPVTSSIDWSKYEPATPEEAFRITSHALKTASAKLNYGAQQAAEKVNEVQRIF